LAQAVTKSQIYIYQHLIYGVYLDVPFDSSMHMDSSRCRF